MELTPEHELIIRKALADTLASIPELVFIIPSPLYCNDIPEFWATLDGENTDTKDEIETQTIAAAWLYPLQFVDDFSSGGIDSPLVRLTYEIYQFRQYGLEREDENENPDIFNSQVLKQHNLFVAGWLGIKAALQGNRNIAGVDPDVFATAKTTSVVQQELIQNLSVCNFVPGAVGFGVKLLETVELKLRSC
jgi:hypothetical protein